MFLFVGEGGHSDMHEIATPYIILKKTQHQSDCALIIVVTSDQVVCSPTVLLVVIQEKH